MSAQNVFDMLLPIGVGLVFIVLIWFIIELIMTIRRTRGAVDDIHTKLNPTLEHVEEITASLKPVVSKVDPLVERVSLTVDAANLEIMRLDQILEDVNEITDTISSAANAVDVAANAPLELVSNVTSRVRNAFKPKRASTESVALGDKKIATAAHDAAQGIKEVVADQGVSRQERKAEQKEMAKEKHAAAEATRETAAQVNKAVKTTIDYDTENIQNKYFTYNTKNEADSQNKEALGGGAHGSFEGTDVAFEGEVAEPLKSVNAHHDQDKHPLDPSSAAPNTTTFSGN